MFSLDPITYVNRNLGPFYNLRKGEKVTITNYVTHQSKTGFSRFIYNFVEFFKSILGLSEQQKATRCLSEHIFTDMKRRIHQHEMLEESDKPLIDKQFQAFAVSSARKIVEFLKNIPSPEAVERLNIEARIDLQRAKALPSKVETLGGFTRTRPARGLDGFENFSILPLPSIGNETQAWLKGSG